MESEEVSPNDLLRSQKERDNSTSRKTCKGRFMFPLAGPRKRINRLHFTLLLNEKERERSSYINPKKGIYDDGKKSSSNLMNFQTGDIKLENRCFFIIGQKKMKLFTQSSYTYCRVKKNEFLREQKFLRLCQEYSN